MLGLGYGLTNAAYRTTKGSGDLRRGDFAGSGERFERLAKELGPQVIAFVGKSAYEGVFRERPEHGLQERRLGETRLFVLPSTSPANAAVPYEERLRWFRALRAELGRLGTSGREAYLGGRPVHAAEGVGMTRLRTFAAFVVVGITTGLIWTGVGLAAPGPCADVMELDTVATGDIGEGWTVVSGTDPQSFDAEVLGVMPDLIGPGRDVIIVEISGPTVDAGGGVWAGMSGSPVYIDHGGGPELAGALAYGFSFGATNIAGLTPAEDMLHVNGLSVSSRAASRVPARIKLPRSVVRKVAAKIGAALPTVGGSLVRLKLPMSISGVAPERYRGDAEAALPEEVPADDEVHARCGCALRQPLRSRGRPRSRRELRRRPLLRRPHLGGCRDDDLRLRRAGARFRAPDALLRADVARRRLGGRDRDRARRARPLQARQRHEPRRHARPGPPRGHPRGGR